MERALKSGQSLTRQLLGVARKQPLRTETLLLEQWLPTCRELLRASLGAKVSLVIDPGTGTWPTRVDVAELELALINVAVNARDAMPNGGRFTVRATNIVFRHEDGFPLTGNFVQLSLEDTGVGMAPEVLARAFEPLFTTKPKGMGTGLGLPQVFAFCESSGGLAAEPGAEESSAPQGLRILLVEDNEEVAAGTEALLQMMGHQVTCVFNADTALRLFDDAHARRARTGEPLPFDLVLSDIHMPGKLNGIDLAEAVLAFDTKLPVILVTGYAEELDRARRVDVRVLSKPFDIGLLEKLLETIQRDLAQTGSDPAEHPAQ
jgi:CheY-like chemotaxis protein